jgi:hypothetical protein
MDPDELIDKLSNIISWLPQPPDKGPPLPRRFNILWSKPQHDEFQNLFSVPEVKVRMVNVKKKTIRRKRK